MDILKRLQKPDIEYWPEVRWWLAEGFHTDETLLRDIQLLYEAGFGAAEFLAMDEPGADSSLYGWGSEEWVHDTCTIIKEATLRGMGASLTSGTNWSNANLTTIGPDEKAASKELDYTVKTVKGGDSHTGFLEKPEILQANVNEQELIAVVAIKHAGEKDGKLYLDNDSSIVLTDKAIGGTLDWTAPSGGDWELFAFWMHGTGQTATPSAGISYAINYLDRYGVDSLINYWNKEVLSRELREIILKNKRVQMYMDSLEILTYGKGGQLWGYHLLEEFEKNCGYSLVPYLPFIVKTGGLLIFGEYNYHYEMKDKNLAEKVRNDLYQTMTELYMNNMLKPMQEWLHSIGMTLRAEISYGLPFEISIPGKYVDGIETESLEFASQIEAYRNLAGPAHLYNKLYSSETGATLMNYMMGLDFYTQIIFTQFAAGVSRTVLHGYSSIAGSEVSTCWPGHEGMLPVFSERFGERQPAWQHYKDWTNMLSRYQMLLRQGKPRIDIGILRLDYTFNNLYFWSGSEKEIYETQFMRANEGVYWKDMKLQNAGYTYDYFAPQILEDESICFKNGVISPEGPGYRALIIYQEALPLGSAEQILAWAKEGLPVVLVNGVTELVRPGGVCKYHKKAASRTPFRDGNEEKLAAVMAEMKKLANVREIYEQSMTHNALLELGVQPRAGFAEPNKNILAALREDADTKYLFAYNYMYTQKEPFACKIAIEGTGKPYRVDCWNGKMEEPGKYEIKSSRTELELTLAPGEAAMILLNTSESDALHAVDTTADEVVRINGSLAVKAFKSGNYSTRMNDGRIVKSTVEVPVSINLDNWELVVEDWNEGEKMTVTEDRGLGIVTREVYYKTSKNKINVGRTELKPWKDIPQVGAEVSGVGYYTATIMLPENWGENNGAFLQIESTNGNSAAVYVNGKKADPVDFERLRADVSSLLVPGENTIRVEVSSTLNNRLLARGYYEKIYQMLAVKAAGYRATMGKQADGILEAYKSSVTVQSYGMTGEVKLVCYTTAKL